MVNAAEINAKLDNYMLRQDERLKRIEDSVTTITANVQASITTLTIKADVLTERVDKGEEDALKNYEDPHSDLNHRRLQQHDPNPRVNAPNPRMNAVDKGAKLDTRDFIGDSGPETFFDWIHSLESFFRWYELFDERKFFFAKAKLKGTAQIWWDQHQRNLYTTAL